MPQPDVPTSIPITEPSLGAPRRRYDFDHVPKLGPAKPGDKRGSLLPAEGGRPGLTYAQVPLEYVRQAEAAGWQPMFDTCRYTIVGPKGSINMELMAMGRLIPGVAPGASRRECLGPLDLICEVTGLDPKTGFPPDPNAPQQEPTDAEAQDSGPEDRSLPSDPEPEDPEGEGGGPELDSSSGGGQGSRYPSSSKRKR